MRPLGQANQYQADKKVALLSYQNWLSTAARPPPAVPDRPPFSYGRGGPLLSRGGTPAAEQRQANGCFFRPGCRVAIAAAVDAAPERSQAAACGKRPRAGSGGGGRAQAHGAAGQRALGHAWCWPMMMMNAVVVGSNRLLCLNDNVVHQPSLFRKST